MTPGKTAIVQVTDWTPETKVLQQPGQPALYCRWRAELSCGCAVYVGIRADNAEAATGSLRCSDAHHGLMARYHELMLKSLENPTDRDLIDVVAELLGQAQAP